MRRHALALAPVLALALPLAACTSEEAEPANTSSETEQSEQAEENTPSIDDKWQSEAKDWAKDLLTYRGALALEECAPETFDTSNTNDALFEKCAHQVSTAMEATGDVYDKLIKFSGSVDDEFPENENRHDQLLELAKNFRDVEKADLTWYDSHCSRERGKDCVDAYQKLTDGLDGAWEAADQMSSNLVGSVD